MNKREIKFRAWHKGADEFCDGSTSNMFGWIDSGQPIVLMQYTGLKDRNGVEIYEGDIVRYKWDTCPVTWVDIHVEPFSYGGGGEMLPEDCEVIGNIYQNPELLGETDEQ